MDPSTVRIAGRQFQAGCRQNYAAKTLVTKVRAKCNRCQAEDTIEVLSKHKCPEEEVQVQTRVAETLLKGKKR